MVNFAKILILIDILLLGQNTLASEYKRTYPKSGRRDTLIQMGNELCSNHPNRNFFEDDEIVQVHQTLNKRTRPGSRKIYIQPSKQGCSIGVTKMLLADHGKDFSSLYQQRKLGDIYDIKEDLKESGLRPRISSFEQDIENLNVIDLLGLLQHGSIVLQIVDDKIGNHFIIMDEVYQNYRGQNLVRIRDPYHAWEISVKADSLLRRIGFEEFLYISS